MPRKPRTGPPMLVIEGLSDGREIRPETFVDDFTQQVMPVVQDMQPVRVMKSAQEAKDEINRAKREYATKVLQSVGLMDKPPEPAKLQSNQAVISDDSGPRLIMSWPKGKKRLRRL